MSNTDVKYNGDPNFSGPGWAVNAVEGCKASAGHCDVGVPHNYNMLPSTNPLQVLDTASFNTRTGKYKTMQVAMLPMVKPACAKREQHGAYGDLKVNAGGTVNFAPGTYFFHNATIDFSGTVNGKDVTFVLLGNSSLSIGSSANVNLSAPATNTTSSLLNGVLIDDQANG